MNCPNCGAGVAPDQQFCRTCGSQLIDDERRSIFPTWPLIALAVTFGSLIVAVAGKLGGIQWLMFAGVILTLCGMFGMAAFGLIGQTRPRRRSVASSANRNDELLRADTTNKLPPLDESTFIPSVVEDTTELLKTPVERKRSGE